MGIGRRLSCRQLSTWQIHYKLISLGFIARVRASVEVETDNRGVVLHNFSRDFYDRFAIAHSALFTDRIYARELPTKIRGVRRFVTHKSADRLSPVVRRKLRFQRHSFHPKKKHAIVYFVAWIYHTAPCTKSLGIGVSSVRLLLATMGLLQVRTANSSLSIDNVTTLRRANLHETRVSHRV